MRDGLPASVLLSMPERDLLALVKSARRPKLLQIYRAGVVCRCEPPGIDPAKWGELGTRVVNCGPDGVPVASFVPCQHTPRNTLPPVVQALVLARLWPADYREPPLDRRPSGAVTYAERLALLVRRARRHRALWHPDDAQQPDGDGLADMFGIRVERTRNGEIVEMGVERLAAVGG